MPLPGGAAGSQKVALPDRTLTISSVRTHRSVRPGSVRPGSVLIELRLAVRNVSGKAISNNPAFFGLIGPGGDSLGAEVRTSAGFFGAIGAYANRSGTLEFQVPSAAENGLYLMYRPEIATETVLTRLYVGLSGRAGGRGPPGAPGPGVRAATSAAAIGISGSAMVRLPRLTGDSGDELGRDGGRRAGTAVASAPLASVPLR